MGQIWTEEFAEKYSNIDVNSANKFFTKVMGTTFLEDKAVLNQIRDDDLVLLIPEMDNKYDPNAVMVMHDNTGKKLGYVKKELAKEIWHNIREQGHLYIAKVELTGDTPKKKEKGINMEVRHLKPLPVELPLEIEV